MDPTVLSDGDRKKLLGEFPKDAERLYALEQHSLDELAVYIADLANTVPPKETRKRYKIYGWVLMKADHYRMWSKREQVRRILTMEKHDRLRRRGKKFGVPCPDIPMRPVGEIDNKNPVKPPEDEMVQARAAEAGAGSVGAPPE